MAFTFFFRDNYSIEQAIKLLLPKIDGIKEINIWDAGCAMGQEPYTLAIMLAEKLGYFTFKKIQIHATDIDENNTFHKIINDGIYPKSELERIPKEYFEKYFTQTESSDYYKINENIKKRVTFLKHNLTTLQPINSNYNFILCKNVLLHLTQQERINVIKMFNSSLVDNGLFLTEQTQIMPEENKAGFKQVTPDANIYEKI